MKILIGSTEMPVAEGPGMVYRSQFDSRYCSSTAKALTSEGYRWAFIRFMWLITMRSQVKLNLLPSPPAEGALDEFERKLAVFDWDRIALYEAEVLHDVDAHRRFVVEDLVPSLGHNAHVGMTSQDPQCNGELLLQFMWLRHIRAHLLKTLYHGSQLVLREAAIAALGWTHWQEGTPITFGHRVAMWLGPLLDDLRRLDAVVNGRELKGIRGATGGNEAMLKLCGGDQNLLKRLLADIESQTGHRFMARPVGQTYPRSYDVDLVSLLSSICSNLAKAAFDIRFLNSHHEVAEPRGIKQKGSSAMPFKRNPMKCERLCALARIPSCFLVGVHEMVRTQGLERTLDDSAFRRFALNESFLATDACLLLAETIFSGLRSYPTMMDRHIKLLQPFLVAEELISAAVLHGADRDSAYRELHSVAGDVWDDILSGIIDKNDLLQRIEANPNSVFVKYGVSLKLPEPIDMTGVCQPEAKDFGRYVLQLLEQPENKALLDEVTTEAIRV